MEKNEAFKLVRSLMDHHGLTLWKLEWMNLKSTAGLCYNSHFTWNIKPELSRGKIEISKYFVEAFTEAEVRELGLHEIAHALVTPGSHHGPEWKAMALKIGSTGARCVSKEEAAKLPSRYQGRCAQNHTFRRHRKNYAMGGHEYVCPACSRKKLDAIIIWTDTATGVTLNPRTRLAKKPEPVAGTTILVTPNFEPKKPLSLPRVVPTPVASSWKDRFDKGDTSFADVW